MKFKIPGARGTIRAYRDDDHIRRLARLDGCLIPLETALARLDGQMTTIITDRRLYLVHAVPGDAGYSAWQCDDPTDLPLLLLHLAPLLGPIDQMRMGRHDQDPRAVGTRH